MSDNKKLLKVILCHVDDGAATGSVYNTVYDAALHLYERHGTLHGWAALGVYDEGGELGDLDDELESEYESIKHQADYDRKYNSAEALRAWHHSRVL